MRRRTYLISYEAQIKEGETARGRIDVQTDQEFRDVEDIISFENIMKSEYGYQNVVVLNIQKFPI